MPITAYNGSHLAKMSNSQPFPLKMNTHMGPSRTLIIIKSCRFIEDMWPSDKKILTNERCSYMLFGHKDIWNAYKYWFIKVEFTLHNTKHFETNVHKMHLIK